MKPIVKWPFIFGLVLLALGPGIGLSGTVFSMLETFSQLSKGNSANADELSANIGNAMLTTTIGIGIGLAGLVLLFIALINYLATRNDRGTRPVEIETPPTN